jgi:hypothetical protein
MKKLVLSLIAAAICTASFTQTEAEQKAWMDFMTPGEVHKNLAKDNGTWATEMKMWMTPGTDPSTSKGTCENTMILGGRYQQSVYKGDVMGMPMEGRGLLAYDNARKVFVSTWIDNMGTGLVAMEGNWNAATKTITFKGKQTNPATGAQDDLKEVFKWIDDNTQLMEMYVVKGSKEEKMMEIRFTRIKK